MKRSVSGISLLEVVVYLALWSSILTITISAAYALTAAASRHQARAALLQEGIYLMDAASQRSDPWNASLVPATHFSIRNQSVVHNLGYTTISFTISTPGTDGRWYSQTITRELADPL